jgi:hypothetical protein
MKYKLLRAYQHLRISTYDYLRMIKSCAFNMAHNYSYSSNKDSKLVGIFILR